MTVLDSIKDCERCSLYKNGKISPKPTHLQTMPYMAVLDTPSATEVELECPLTDIPGGYLKKLFKQAGYRPEQIHFTYILKCHTKGNLPEHSISQCRGWLWEEIKLRQPDYIFTFCNEVATLLLKRKIKWAKDLGAAQSVDYMASKIVPFYSISYMLQRGKKVDELVVSKLKDYLCST